MVIEKIRSSYGSRADEYVEYLGSVEAVAAQDRLVIVDTHARTDQGSRPHGAILARLTKRHGSAQ